MKTPITYYGGKQKLIKHIIPFIPEHIQYVEPFFGGGAVLFAKTPSKNEVINDISDMVITFWRVCKLKFEKLQKEIEATLHSESLHRKAKTILKDPEKYSDIQRAWAFWVQSNMSFGSDIFKGFAFSERGEGNRTSNKRQLFTPEIKERLGKVEIFNRDALELIKTKDSPDTFFYLDPPYPESDCGHYKEGKEVFYKLLEILPGIKGKFLLSSYPSAELDKFRKENGYQYKDISLALGVDGKGNKGRKKTECLTRNYKTYDFFQDMFG